MSDSPNRMAAIESAMSELGTDPDGGADVAPDTTPTPIETPIPDTQPPDTDASPPVPEPDGTGKTTETPAQAAQRARDEAGRFTKAPVAPKAVTSGTKPPLAGAKAQTPAPKAHEGAQAVQPVAKAEKPPPSWSPPAREHWSKLPQEVREDVWRREQETSMALRESAEARQFHQTFAKMAAPYETMFRAEGVDALRGAGNLFQAFGVLQQGNPGAKAQLLATIGKTYGIDPQLLTDAWNGTASPEAQHAQSVDPRTIAQQVRAQVMADLQQERQQTHLSHASSEVETFGQDKEFFHDVRGTMAAILDGATASRQHMTLDQAYKIALQFHPGTSSVLQRREANEVARNAQASTERARLASSSVRSQPVSPPRAARDYGDRMTAIEAAWEEAASR